ncbi:MAG: nitronate monooxygenase [Novosphingobium sp.]|nr:nitronate monooxygenase [Novosphingobium sp.]
MALAQHIREKLTLPAFCAPMFLCSTQELAAESRKAGIVGSLTANHCRDLEELESHLAFVSESVARFADEQPGKTIGPFAVNVAPTKDPADFAVWLDACKRHGTDIIVTSVGNPTAVAPVVRDYGFQHYHDVTNMRFAEKAASAGVDGMIAIGAGGGGHAGTISHLAFIPKIREMFDGTVVMAGAVTTGGAIRAAEMLGADLAYLGTRFIATRESGAPDPYKAMLVDGGIDDVIYTRGVNGMPASWLKASLREAGLDPENLVMPEGRSTDHLPADKTPWRDIWSGGQGIGLIDAIPTTVELVAQLQREYVEACAIPDSAEAARAALGG